MLMCLAPCADAQIDSVNQRTTMDTIRLTEEENRQLQNAMLNPGWYVIKQIASYFNVGVYYSYLTPVGAFKKEVPATSAFTFDFGLDLTRMFGKNETNLHLIIGLNADYANFGKTKSPYTKTNGDTTYEVTLKNSIENYSYFLEAEWRKSFLTPFASVAYSELFMYPYKQVKTTFPNHTSETHGEDLNNNKAKGINLTAGLKCKYRFNNHTELMILSKVSYLRAGAINMLDRSSITFLPNGEITYQTYTVHPTWLMYSVGVKYNF